MNQLLYLPQMNIWYYERNDYIVHDGLFPPSLSLSLCLSTEAHSQATT